MIYNGSVYDLWRRGGSDSDGQQNAERLWAAARRAA